MAGNTSQICHEYKLKIQQAILNGEVVKVAFEKCPLCFENRKSLTCHTCVNTGAFSHSRTQAQGERFGAKRRKWWEKLKTREENCRRFEQYIDDIVRANTKGTKVDALKRKIIRLKKAVKETQAALEHDKKKLSSEKKLRRHAAAYLDFGQARLLPDARQINQNLSETSEEPLPSLEELCAVKYNKNFDVRLLISDTASNRPSRQCRRDNSSLAVAKSISRLRRELSLFHQYLAICRAHFVKVLARRIFPIEEVYVRSECDSLEMSMATALRDACETAFIGGRWVHIDHSGENHCTILGSTLPDYQGTSSAVSLFGVASRFTGDNSKRVPVGNASFGIYSALGYTVLFTNLIARILDVHLPRICVFHELLHEMRESDFCNFVWRLHQNIMHLAYSQRVDPNELADNLSLENLMAVINAPCLGSTCVFEPSFVMPVEAEQCPLEYEESDHEEEQVKEDEENAVGGTEEPDFEVPKDWERVPAGIPSYDGSHLALSSSPSTSVFDNTQSTAGQIFNTASAAATSAAATLTGWLSSYYGKK